MIGGVVDHYEPEMFLAQDYYPFGMLQPDRQWRSGDYRYGFNNKENDTEVKGNGNQQDYGMRMYDPRLGKFLSVDPLKAEYPWNSTYAFAENDIIRSIDVDGAEKHVPTLAYGVSNGQTVTKVISNDYKQPVGTSNIYAMLGGRPTTTEETVAQGFVSANKLPAGGTFSFFVFAPELKQSNYARYEYTDIGGKQQVRYFSAEYVDFMYEHFEKEQQQAEKILRITGAVANLGVAGSLLKSELQAAKSEVTGGSRDLNPTKGTMNCANCTFAGDLTLKGTPATATNILLRPDKGVNYKRFFEAWGGMRDVSLHSSPESIMKTMEGMSEGATGVIMGLRTEGVGHYFNVTKQNGIVQFVDFQLGIGERAINPSSLMQNYNFDYLLFKNTTGIKPIQTKW